MKSTHTDLDVALEKRIDDCWNVDGNRSLSDSWTGFTRFTLLNETPPKGWMWSGARLTKIQTTSRPDHRWPGAWTRFGKAARRRENQEWAVEEPKLEYARNSRRIYSIDSGDENYKDFIKNAKRKLEKPTATATPCQREFSKASVRKLMESGAETEFSCIAEIDETTRQRNDFSTHRIHNGHNAGKEQNSVVYCNLFAKQVKPREGRNITLRRRRVNKSSHALRLPSGNRGYVAEEGL